MLFAGLWFGEKKPAMWSFLKPHVQVLQTLENGVEFESPTRGKFTCRAVLLCVTCDLPARCLVCNGMQYNGEHGCWKCLQSGLTVPAGAGYARAFPYQQGDPKGPARDKTNVFQHAKEATVQQLAGKSRYVVMGVKGPSWLSHLRYFDIVRGVAINYMHGVLLGVQKLLLKLWFKDTYVKCAFSIRKWVERVDVRLQNISPTLDVKRLPRTISGHIKYWKASELKSFLLYYGLPTLYGLLPDEYFEHYFCFVRATYLLLQGSIAETHLTMTEQLLDNFCGMFSRLYQLRFETLNLHQLLHLTDDVRDFGPLFTHSCFSFEDKNGFILKLIHGTQFIDKQIISAVSITQKLPELREKCFVPGSAAETLYNKLHSPSRPQRGEEILPGVYMIGKEYSKCLNNCEFQALEQFLGYAPFSAQVDAFNRIEFRSSYIYGLAYKRMTRRNCATIKYRIQDAFAFAQVNYFIRINSTSGVHHLAVVKALNCSNYNPLASSVSAVSHMDTILVIAISQICSNCLYVDIVDDPSKSYVCEIPNILEQD